MEIIALIVSGLALLAAGVCLHLLVQEKKRNQERNAAEKEIPGQIAWCIEAIGSETSHRVEVCNKLVERISEMEERFDPEAIRKSAEEIVAQAVNDVCEKIAEPYGGHDFGLGINNIMNFDPRESIARQREKERTGE